MEGECTDEDLDSWLRGDLLLLCGDLLELLAIDGDRRSRGGDFLTSLVGDWLEDLELGELRRLVLCGDLLEALALRNLGLGVRSGFLRGAGSSSLELLLQKLERP